MSVEIDTRNQRESTPSPSISIKSIELGDIIQIHAPQNREIDTQIYYVFYVDEEKLKLLNTSNRQLLSLKIKSYIADESIVSVDLLSRSQEKGFARQNKLLPLTWVDIHFGGDMPAVISGQITNLEEDMIEITTINPSSQVIYIDFAYQGMPEDLPIERIDIRDKPAFAPSRLTASDEPEITREEAEAEASIEYDNQGEFIVHIPDNVMPNPSVADYLEDMIDHETSLPVDDDLGTLLVYIEVPESERRYSVESQVADLMGELLSKFPSDNTAHLADIHRLVTRFKQLRHQFSRFDANENVIEPKRTDATQKPMIDRILHLDTPIPWVVPVVKETRVVYKVTFLNEATDDYYPAPNLEIQLTEDDLAQLVAAQKTAEYDTQLRRISELMESTSERTDTFSLPVNHSIETVVDNDGHFRSAIVAPIDRRTFTVGTASFVNRRLTPADTRLFREDHGRQKYTYERRDIAGTHDTAHIHSLLFLPRSTVVYSRSQCPSTNIFLRSKLASVPLYKHKMLRELTNITHKEIQPSAEEIVYRTAPEEAGEPFLDHITHYSLNKDVPLGEDTFHAFLNTILPRTRRLIRWVRDDAKHLYSMFDMTTMLEPFLIDQDNITFNQYKEIRYFILQQIKAYVLRLEEERKNFAKLKAPIPAPATAPAVNRTEDVFKDLPDFLTFFKETYGLGRAAPKSAAELIHWVSHSDAGKLYFDMIHMSVLKHLTLPTNLIESVVDASEQPKISDQDCTRRFLAKKYTSLVQLQKDNGESTIFYDKVYDDTPYHLLSKYKDERKRFDAEEFREFFVEKLIGAHDCPPYLAPSLAETILLGKKRVVEGEYAVLEIRPSLGSGLQMDDLTAAEKREAESEADTRKKTEYYRRVKDEWVRDTEVNADHFLDTNALFCNITSQCNKLPESNTCVPNVSAAMQMRIHQRAKMIDEFDSRVSKSLDELRAELETSVNAQRIVVKRSLVLNELRIYKANDYAYQLGKFVSSATETIEESPNAPMREQILADPDFVRRQRNLHTFVLKHCRPPMEKELNEDAHWYYCIQSNLKLIPQSLKLLSDAYLAGNYTQVLDALCRSHGTLSDDGDSIVDKYSGYVLRKIDYSSEEGFDESGFVVKTNAMVEKDIATVLLETKERVFKDAVSRKIYNVYRSLASNIGLDHPEIHEGLEDRVLRISHELIVDPEIVPTESDYTEKHKNKEQKAIPYEIFWNRSLIIIVASLTLATIQTQVPTMKLKKTFPGCVKSFEGYPLDPNTESIQGMKYISCILHKMRTAASPPWNAIDRLSVDTLIAYMKNILQKQVLARTDVQERYQLKRAYLVANPDDVEIPNAVAVSKWTHFVPSLFPVVLEKPPIGITREFERELWDSIRKGTADQLQYIQGLKGKTLKHAYGMCELIQQIVSSKRTLLATSSGQPFLENACCTDGSVYPLRYFIQENANVEIYAKKVVKIGQELDRVKYLSKARILFDPDSSRLTYTRLPDTIVEQVIYEAYMYYCHFHSDIPIPAHLSTVCTEKPAYDRYGSLTEKIAYLKKHGKTYGIDQFHALMHIVNSRNRVHVLADKEIPCIEGFKDMLDYFEEKHSHIVEDKLRQLIGQTLADYQPTIMVHEERASVRDLNRYLMAVNDRISKDVCRFLENKKYANVTGRQLGKIKELILGADQWDTDIHVAYQQIQNSVYLLTKVYPTQILNRHYYVRTPSHWNFAPEHESVLKNAIHKHYAQIQSFFEEKSMGTSLPILHSFLNRLQLSTNDLVLFLEQIPRLSEVKKTVDGNVKTFYSLFPSNTILLLFKYCWYSVLHEYIVLLDDDEFIQLLREEIREDQKTMDDVFGQEETRPDNPLDTQLREIHIFESSNMKLKKTVGQLLVSMLLMEDHTKHAVNKSYATIMENTMKLKYKDKKRITDYLANLPKDERKVEQMLREHKLGKWNVGEQKSLYKYNKQVYVKDREANVFGQADTRTFGQADTRTFGQAEAEGETEAETQFELEGFDPEDLERMAEEENRVYEDEGYDISHLDEEYENGHQYEEDYAEDRETDF